MNHYLKLLSSAVILMLILAVSGCGQKGDLYLPSIPPAPAFSGPDLNSGPALNDDNEEGEKKQSKLLDSPKATESE